MGGQQEVEGVEQQRCQQEGSGEGAGVDLTVQAVSSRGAAKAAKDKLRVTEGRVHNGRAKAEGRVHIRGKAGTPTAARAREVTTSRRVEGAVLGGGRSRCRRQERKSLRERSPATTVKRWDTLPVTASSQGGKGGHHRGQTAGLQHPSRDSYRGRGAQAPGYKHGNPLKEWTVCKG